VSNKDLAGTSLSTYYSNLVGSRIIIQKSGDPSKFGIYNVTASTASQKFTGVTQMNF